MSRNQFFSNDEPYDDEEAFNDAFLLPPGSQGSNSNRIPSDETEHDSEVSSSSSDEGGDSSSSSSSEEEGVKTDSQSRVDDGGIFIVRRKRAMSGKPSVLPARDMAPCSPPAIIREMKKPPAGRKGKDIHKP